MSGQGNGQLRAFVERIMRMKEEARAINDDVREIYAEAKAEGFDKTVLGQVVSYLEKREKDPAAFAERSALFDLYISQFETGTALATHTHEADTPSTAARKDVPGALPDNQDAAPSDDKAAEQSHKRQVEPPVRLSAGTGEADTQAPPVDTHSRIPDRQPGCQHPDACAGTWRARCFTCEKAFNAEQGEAA